MAAPTVTPITERRHAAGFLVGDVNDGMFSRKQITLASGAGVLTAGIVLGRVSGGVAVAGANTGNGTFGNIVQLPGSLDGAYTLACTQATTGTPAATAQAHEGNVGTGTVGAITVTNPASLGAYRLELTATGATAAYDVFTPAGTLLATGNVASVFTHGGLSFTLANAGTMTAGDSWDIIVSDNGVALFSLTGPDGTALPTVTVGAAYNHALDFTLSQGATKFVLGDSFTINTAGAGALYSPYDPTATNGLQYAAAILLSEYRDTTSANQKAAALTSGPSKVNAAELLWGANVTTLGQQTSALAQLDKLGIRSV